MATVCLCEVHADLLGGELCGDVKEGDVVVGINTCAATVLGVLGVLCGGFINCNDDNSITKGSISLLNTHSDCICGATKQKQRLGCF